MKLTKNQAKSFLKGWDYVKQYNTSKMKPITKEIYIDAFDQTIKEGKEFCAKCDLCNKC